MEECQAAAGLTKIRTVRDEGGFDFYEQQKYERIKVEEEATMEKKRRDVKKKGPLIRDLSKTAIEELDPDQMHVISGGIIYTCGSAGADCGVLFVIKNRDDQLTIICGAKSARTIKF